MNFKFDKNKKEFLTSQCIKIIPYQMLEKSLLLNVQTKYQAIFIFKCFCASIASPEFYPHQNFHLQISHTILIKYYTFCQAITIFFMSSSLQNAGWALIEGTTFAYYVQKKLGQGFGGLIYEGINTANSSSVAVKIIKNYNFIENQITFTEMLRITADDCLKGKNAKSKKNWLVKVFDVIQMDKTYVIMQLCQSNLKDYLNANKQRKNQNQLLKILTNIIEALRTVTEEGYHFCDLKPENILINKQGEAKLGDLQSLIKLRDYKEETKSSFHEFIFGTLHYMSPQLIELGQYGEKNYIWALGIMLHQIIYDEPPFKITEKTIFCNEHEKRNHYASFYKKLFDLQIKLSLADCYPRCQNLIKHMLRFNKKRRISLQKMYEYLIKQDISPDQLLKIPSQNFKKRVRSNSQLTRDSQDPSSSSYGLSPEPKLIKNWQQRKLSHQNCLKILHYQKKQLQTFQNQKQIPSSGQRLGAFSLEGSCETKYQDRPLNQLFSEIQKCINCRITPLIEAIKSPLVLVKKLKYLNAIFQDLLDKLKNSAVQNEREIMYWFLNSFQNQIKTSRAFFHLQKTLKYSSLQKNSEIYRKQIQLLQNLHTLFQIIDKKIDKNQKDRKTYGQENQKQSSLNLTV